MDPGKLVRSQVRELTRPVHGGKAWMFKNIEDFSHNLNPLGPPEGIADAIASAVDGLGHYPDDSAVELRRLLAERHGVMEENVIVGSGSSELIRLFPETFITPGDPVLIPRPSFAEYAFQCSLMGAKVNHILLMEGEDFRVDVNRALDQMRNYTKAVYLCNPNNPTGRIEPRSKIMEVVEECERRSILVFLDETLLELVQGHRDLSCAAEVLNHDNLFIIGSFTKSFAIPGVRVGYGMGSRAMIRSLNRARLSWNVGHIEQRLACWLLQECQGYLEGAAATLDSEKRWMHRELVRIGFPVDGEPDSYFFFCSVKKMDINAAELQKMLLSSGTMVRDCASFGKPFNFYTRFCVKTRERNQRFVESLENVLGLLNWR